MGTAPILPLLTFSTAPECICRVAGTDRPGGHRPAKRPLSRQRARAIQRPTQAHHDPAPGSAEARKASGERASGARHGTAAGRVPGVPQKGRAGGPAPRFKPDLTKLGREGRSSYSSRGSLWLAKAVPETCTETEAREYPGPAQPRSGGGSAPGQHSTAPTECRQSSAPSAFTPRPIFPDQHHLLEGSSLVGPPGTVCGTGIWPGLLRPVLVLLDVCRDTRPWGEEGGREERLLCVQPGLRGHPGHPDCRAAGARVTDRTPGGDLRRSSVAARPSRTRLPGPGVQGPRTVQFSVAL